jgi:SET family sugar efflux transporter-like MFS transporter
VSIDLAPRTQPIGRTLLPLAVVFLAVGISTAVVGPFLSLFLSSEIHAGPLQVTIFLVGAPLAAVAASALVARLSDRPGMRRRLMIPASAAGALGAGLTAFLRSYPSLLAIALTATAFAGALYPQAFAYAREVLARVEPSRAAMGISSLRTVRDGQRAQCGHPFASAATAASAMARK